MTRWMRPCVVSRTAPSGNLPRSRKNSLIGPIISTFRPRPRRAGCMSPTAPWRAIGSVSPPTSRTRSCTAGCRRISPCSSAPTPTSRSGGGWEPPTSSMSAPWAPLRRRCPRQLRPTGVSRRPLAHPHHPPALRPRAHRAGFRGIRVHRAGGPLARIIFEEWRQARVLLAGWHRRYMEAIEKGEIGLENAVAEYLESR